MVTNTSEDAKNLVHSSIRSRSLRRTPKVDSWLKYVLYVPRDVPFNGGEIIYLRVTRLVARSRGKRCRN